MGGQVVRLARLEVELTLRAVLTIELPGQAGRRNVVRYNSPTFKDLRRPPRGAKTIWAVSSLTYKGEIHDFLGRDFLVACPSRFRTQY